ncbi:1,4-dihydroxy-2-naphthoate polyprenyltransferase [Halocatena halophila]|uniref:1,4-dihydroxy-2-naphthoate polyprenyltransferase n=1 Tax=Halocatena halophila TaxID=2814576 RepID=UPI002ED42317
MTEHSTTRAWLLAARPQTLPAGAAPVVLGTGLAIRQGVFRPLPAVLALLGALLLQIGTNFANDYYDAIKGADTDEREGFTRVTQAGLIEPAAVKRAMILTFLIAVGVGCVLVAIGGVPILLIGLASIGAGFTYTGGPYPYGYRGLGDLFVFVFFGVIAVTGTYYVQAIVPYGPPLGLSVPSATLPTIALLVSLAPAALATAILVINNIRDRETDAAAGKRTLAVMLGYRLSRFELLALLALAYAVPLWLVMDTSALLVGLPVVTIPIAARLVHTVFDSTSAETLDPALERMGQLLGAHSLLFAVGLALS